MNAILKGVSLAAALVVCVCLVGGHAVEAQSAAHDVDLDAAMRVLDASLKKARELNTNMNIAILDDGGNLKAFVRMDGAFLGSADIAMKKAKTSRLFNGPSDALKGLSEPGGPLLGIEASNGGLITFAGGLPLANSNGEVIGSISMVNVGDGTGRLEDFHVESQWQADRRLSRRLARTAADFARERGLLKLVIDVPEDLPGLPQTGELSSSARAAVAESRVKAYFEMLGFVFSRKREVDDKTMLEFYIDLYQPPAIDSSAT